MTEARQIDTRWFKYQLELNDLNQRKAAKHIGIEASSFSRMIRGLRDMSTSEARLLAALLKVSVTELLSHYGIDIEPPPGKQVPMVGRIDHEWRVHLNETDQHELVPAPRFNNAVALRVESNNIYDGWLMYYRPMKCISSKAARRLCVVELEETGEKLIGKLRYNSNFNGYILIAMDGTASDTVELKTASPIWWVKP